MDLIHYRRVVTYIHTFYATLIQVTAVGNEHRFSKCNYVHNCNAPDGVLRDITKRYPFKCHYLGTVTLRNAARMLITKTLIVTYTHILLQV